jgi:NADH dehydrogenase
MCVTNYETNHIHKFRLTFETANRNLTAGVQGAYCEVDWMQTAYRKRERIRVNEFNQVVGYGDIFAVGDIASMESALILKVIL